jgi:hypothetical protein
MVNLHNKIPPSQTCGEELMPKPWTIIAVAKTNNAESQYMIRITNSYRQNNAPYQDARRACVVLHIHHMAKGNAAHFWIN